MFFVLKNLVLVLMMHEVFSQKFHHSMEERMNKMERQMNNMKDEIIAWLTEELISKFHPMTDKQDPKYKVNILL